jgi:hypothetical protein
MLMVYFTYAGIKKLIPNTRHIVDLLQIKNFTNFS